jgi:hypothetical protein
MQLQAPTIVTKIIPLTLFKVFKNTRLGKAYFLKRNYHFESEFALIYHTSEKTDFHLLSCDRGWYCHGNFSGKSSRLDW